MNVLKVRPPITGNPVCTVKFLSFKNRLSYSSFAPNWTAKLEYDNLFLSDRNFTVQTGFPVIGGHNFSTVNRDVQTVTVGINYLFNWQ